MLLRIQIISTGEFLVMGKDSTLPMEQNTTLFNDAAELLGDKSYQVTLPLQPNKAMIRNAHLILTDAARRSLDVRVWINQYPWLIGRMVYTIDGENIVGNIYANLSLYVNQLKTLQLNNLSDPLINDQKHFDTYADYCAYLKATTTAAPGAEIMVFFPFRNTGAYKTIDPDSYADYPDINLPVNEVFNAWQTDEENNGSFLVDESFPIRQTQVPFFYLPYILKRIVRLLGFRPVGKWLDEEAPNRIVVASLIPVASWNIIADYWLYMPAVPVADFLKAVRTEFGLVIAFNEVDKICIIESLSNLVKTGDIVDLRLYQVAGSMRETGSSSQAYTITQTPDDKDTIFSDDEKQNLPVLTIGTPVTAIQTTDVPMISATTKMITESSPAFPSPSNWRIPAMSQPVAGSAPLDQISSVENADAHNFRIRFLYYHGLVPDDSNLFSYPYGSSDNKDKNGNIIADTSLSLTAADQLNLDNVIFATNANHSAAYSSPKIGFGVQSPTSGGDFQASTTAQASARIYNGTAPISPNDGDIWKTAASGLQFYDGTSVRTITPSDIVNSATDANYTITSANQLVKLPVVTANRTVSIPTASSYTGRIIRIWNQNTSGTFNWSFTGATVKDAAGNTLTALVNTSVYILESDGSNWVKEN